MLLFRTGAMGGAEPLGIPCALFSERVIIEQSSGKSCREIADVCLRCLPHPDVMLAKAGIQQCAEYERQLGGASPLSSLMTAKD